MKKKGFTLIEMLAVIIILALIAVIAVPTIIKLVENTKKETFITSIENLMTSFESLNNDAHLTGEKYDSLIATSDLLPVNVNKFQSGQILYDDNEDVKVEFVTNGDYCATGTLDNLQVTKGGCADLDNSEPIIDNISFVATSGTIRMIITAHDPESGIKNISYSLNNADFISISNDYTIRDLDEATTYNIVIRVTNGKDMYTDESRTVITRSLAVPTMTVAPTGWQQKKVVTINFPEGNYIYSYNKDGEGWITTTDLTKEIVFNENGYIIARVSDGVNKLESSTLNVQYIDNDVPTCSIQVANLGVWRTSKVLTISATDTTSGVYGIKVPNASTYTIGDIATYTATTSGVYTATVIDNAGRTNTCAVSASRIDSTAPKNVVLAMQSRTESSIVVEANGIDNESGIIKYEYKIDGGSYQDGGPTNTFIFSGVTAGSHTVQLRVTNAVGLVTESGTTTISMIVATAPTFTVSSTDWTSEKQVAIIFPPRKSYYEYQYKKNDGTWQTLTSGVTTTLEFSANGTAYARVLVGGSEPETPESFNVTKIDNQGPTKPTVEAKFTSNNGVYVSGTWTNNQVYTKVLTSDTGIGVSKIQYSMDQVNWTDFQFSRSSGLQINGASAYGEEVWSLTNRNNTYYIRAIDTLGNISAVSDPFIIRYDLVKPVCSIAGPYTTATGTTTATHVKNDSKIYYNVSCTDANNISNGADATEITRSNTTYLKSITLYNTENITDGKKYIFEVTAGTGNGTATIGLPVGVVADATGNTNETALTSNSIIIDNTAPSCSWSGPSPSSVSIGSNTTYTLTCTDSQGITSGYYSTNISSYVSASSGISITNTSRSGTATSYTYTFTVNATTGVGTRNLTLNAGTLGDTAKNYNSAVSSSDLTVNYPPVQNAELFSGRNWWYYSSTTKGLWSMSYDYQREGANMKYRINWNAWLSSGGSWYDNAMVAPINLNNSNVDTIRIKYSQSNNKGWNYSGQTGWYYVYNVTSGSVPFSAQIVDKGGSYETGWSVLDTAGTYYLTVVQY